MRRCCKCGQYEITEDIVHSGNSKHTEDWRLAELKNKLQFFLHTFITHNINIYDFNLVEKVFNELEIKNLLDKYEVQVNKSN